MIRACCNFMSSLLENTDGDSFSAFLEVIGKRRVISLRSRPFTRRIAKLILKHGTKIDIGKIIGEHASLNLDQSVVIKFCPQCGADLFELIDAQTSEFDQAMRVQQPPVGPEAYADDPDRQEDPGRTDPGRTDPDRG